MDDSGHMSIIGLLATLSFSVAGRSKKCSYSTASFTTFSLGFHLKV